MRTKEERRALHMHKPNAKPVSGNRTKLNSETVKFEEGLAYQEINIDGQTYYAKLEPSKEKITEEQPSVMVSPSRQEVIEASGIYTMAANGDV